MTTNQDGPNTAGAAEPVACGNIPYPVPDELRVRFWDRVNAGGPDECWPWKGNISQRGYGILHRAKIRKNLRANRLSFAIHNGPIPDGMMVCHTCDNPSCCNPKHLYAGTNQDNVNDREARGRSVTPPHIAPKLTDEQAIAVFRSQKNISTLSREYGVDRGAIRRIKAGVSYKRIHALMEASNA